eukprot:412276_1
MPKVNEKEIKVLMSLIDDDNISLNIKTFVNMNRKEFAMLIKKHTNIRPASAVKLYKQIINTLKDKAQRLEFGTVLSNISTANNDYYHILKVHINEGNKLSITNSFR